MQGQRPIAVKANYCATPKDFSMRKTAGVISLSTLAIALAALWPKAALAGPTAQIVAPASIQSIAFANSPSADDYAAGEQIRITVTFDRNVTVTGQPKIALSIGRQQRRATYAQGSGSANLTFSYTVQASDWDGNGVSVPAGAIELSGGGIIDSNNLAVSRTHTGIADDSSRKVKGAADTNPSFGTTTISAQNYLKGTAITDLILPAATGGQRTAGLPLFAGAVGRPDFQRRYPHPFRHSHQHTERRYLHLHRHRRRPRHRFSGL